jgi:hypothetical protein
MTLQAVPAGNFRRSISGHAQGADWLAQRASQTLKGCVSTPASAINRLRSQRLKTPYCPPESRMTDGPRRR